jgi:NAD(P)-dependent dehydrogenase (short-subunit alcohol dehydrogenase family)
MKNLFSLEGRVALVTGGSRGIGRMIASGFLAQGATVYISSRKAEACEETARELSALGPCFPLPADVSTVEGARGLAAAFTQRSGHLDILVNNAGAAWGETFDTFPEKGWDKVVDLNLKSPFFLTQALHEALRRAAAARPAKVINVASIDGVSVNPLETYSYAASKAGVLQLTRSLAVAWAADKIQVNAILPGYISTPLTVQSRKDFPGLDEHVLQRTPAGRWGTPEDFAGPAVFLASKASDFVTGEFLVVDGGYTQGLFLIP